MRIPGGRLVLRWEQPQPRSGSARPVEERLARLRESLGDRFARGELTADEVSDRFGRALARWL